MGLINCLCENYENPSNRSLKNSLVWHDDIICNKLHREMWRGSDATRAAWLKDP